MKKIYILAAGLMCLLAAGCQKDMKSLSSFNLSDVDFTDNDAKMHLSYFTDLSALSYDSGVDHIYVNGEEFTVYQRGTSTTSWTAEGTTAVEAEHFYSVYADGAVSGYSDGTYTFNMSSNQSTTNGIVLAGSTDDYKLTLTPLCAILRVPLGETGYTVKVGFEGNKIPKAGTINVKTGKITAAASYINAVNSSASDNQFLFMHEDADNNYYIGVPILNSSVTTYLYLEWTKGGNTTKYRTSGQVTLQPGYVYTLGTTRVSPFDADGAGIGEFYVSGSTSVAFSRGNLTGQPKNKRFFFPDNQYVMQTDGNNGDDPDRPGPNGRMLTYIDLYGWATSNEGTYYMYLASGNASDYYSAGSINGTNYDWGVKNSGNKIFRDNTFNTVSGHSWRTLTEAEWNYLLTNQHWGLADLNINGNHYYGMILKPYDVYNAARDEWNSWSCDVAFNQGSASGYQTNSLSAADWKKLENSGVIFLPAAGYRIGGGKTREATTNGYYWTSTITATSGMAPNHAKALKFNSLGKSIGNQPRMDGCAVRLVTNW